jgi:hypothetical protein
MRRKQLKEPHVGNVLLIIGIINCACCGKLSDYKKKTPNKGFIYVFYLCFLFMFFIYVFYLCFLFMFFIYVFMFFYVFLCFLFMFFIYVFYLCFYVFLCFFMFCIYVCILFINLFYLQIGFLSYMRLQINHNACCVISAASKISLSKSVVSYHE